MSARVVENAMGHLVAGNGDGRGGRLRTTLQPLSAAATVGVISRRDKVERDPPFRDIRGKSPYVYIYIYIHSRRGAG